MRNLTLAVATALLAAACGGAAEGEAPAPAPSSAAESSRIDMDIGARRLVVQESEGRSDEFDVMGAILSIQRIDAQWADRGWMTVRDEPFDLRLSSWQRFTIGVPPSTQQVEIGKVPPGSITEVKLAASPEVRLLLSDGSERTIRAFGDSETLLEAPLSLGLDACERGTIEADIEATLAADAGERIGWTFEPALRIVDARESPELACETPVPPWLDEPTLRPPP